LHYKVIFHNAIKYVKKIAQRINSDQRMVAPIFPPIEEAHGLFDRRVSSIRGKLNQWLLIF